MARQLVVCLDGTGNRFSHRPTNILRLLRSLSAHPDEVLAYYDQGVGTFGLKRDLVRMAKVAIAHLRAGVRVGTQAQRPRRISVSRAKLGRGARDLPVRFLARGIRGTGSSCARSSHRAGAG